MLEKSITQSILAYLNSLPGCRATKRHGSAYSSGEPDIDACLNGKCVKLEVKGAGKRPTPLQVALLLRWKAAGAVTGVVHCTADVESLLKKEGLL